MSQGMYEQPCSTDGDCPMTNFCDPKVGQCLCPNFISRKIIQFFDKGTQQCLSAVGKGCTLDEDPFFNNFYCVPNAVCTRDPSLPSNWGVCICQPGFEVTKTLLCAEKKTVLLSGSGGTGSIVAHKYHDRWPNDESDIVIPNGVLNWKGDGCQIHVHSVVLVPSLILFCLVVF